MSTQCDLDIVAYTPSGASVGTVVLSHGFVRSIPDGRMGRALREKQGFTTIVPDLCQSSFTNTDHEANAEDIVEHRQPARRRPGGLHGHSAGGLASALALSLDASAVGLDPVDSGSMGADASFSTSFVALFGEPGLQLAVEWRRHGQRPGTACVGRHCDFRQKTPSATSPAVIQPASPTPICKVVQAFNSSLGLYSSTRTMRGPPMGPTTTPSWGAIAPM